jgi:hypothetical protein
MEILLIILKIYLLGIPAALIAMYTDIISLGGNWKDQKLFKIARRAMFGSWIMVMIVIYWAATERKE